MTEEVTAMDLISVIIPVYKAEPFLNHCIQSVADQTYQNLEIILVDDGSPDNSGTICDIWAAKDSRIKVIHQENTGGAQARNAALDAAAGDLIAFVDSDDYIAPDMYTHLVSLLKQGADIAECGHVNVTDDAVIFEKHSLTAQKYTAEEAMRLHIQDIAFRQLIWNKLYRREIIGGIRFPKGKKIDDEFFTYQVLGNAQTLIRSDKICYAYRQQSDSVMHSMGAAGRLQAIEAKVQRENYIEHHFPALTALNRKNLWFTCLYHGQLSLREMDKHEAKPAIDYLCGVLKNYPLELAGCTAKEKLWLSLAGRQFRAACHLRNLLKIGL